MPVRILLGPLWMMALAGAWILAVAYGRREVWGEMPRWPFAIAGALVLVLAGVHAAVFGATALVSRSFGLVLAMGSALCAFFASRARGKAALLNGSRPTSLDEAVASLRAGKPWGPGVLRGRLGAVDEVASPGGIVCAGYEAELRVDSSRAGKGALLSIERDYAHGIYLRGERCSARIAVAEGSLWAPVRVTRCKEEHVARVASGGAAIAMDAASGIAPTRVVSHEKVAKLGAEVWVVGRLVRGCSAGSYLIKGPRGGPAFLALESGIEQPARTLRTRAWTSFALAVVLCLASAKLLAG